MEPSSICGCSERTMNQEISLANLDEYCLRHIFSYLCFLDKVSIGNTCRRFSDIIEHQVENIELNFNHIYYELSLPLATDLFERYGPKIKKIFMKFDADADMQDYYVLVPKNCRNIEEITFDFPYYVDTRIMRMIFNASRNVKFLECRVRYPDLADRHCNYIGKLTELETLHLGGNTEITGMHLGKLTKLKDLNISQCERFYSRYLTAICKAAKLKKLNIEGCSLLHGGAFNIIVNTQSELEEIVINNCYERGDVKVLAQLENLQHVYLHHHYIDRRETPGFLDMLAEHRHRTLRTLCIYHRFGLTQTERSSILKLSNLLRVGFVGHADLNDAFISELSKACPKLQHVSFSQCRKITNDGVVELVTNLENLSVLDLRRCGQLDEILFNRLVELKSKMENGNRLTLYMGYTKISNVNQLINYSESKKWIDLSLYPHFGLF